MRLRLFGPLLAVLIALACGTSDQSDAENLVGFGPSSVAGKSYQGEEITADLPLSEMFWNIGSRVDGYGMCVMTSIEQGARYQGLSSFRGLRDWAARYPGGAYPSKVDAQLKQYAAEKGIAVPDYLQYTGSDNAELSALLELIDKTGRVACVAYGYDPRYGRPINHMVFSPKPGSGKYAVIVDNNQIGGVTSNEASRYVWMTRAEFVDRLHTSANNFGRVVKGSPWVFVWLAPPPPPVPAN